MSVRPRRLLFLASAALVALAVVAGASGDNVNSSVDETTGFAAVAPGGSVGISWRIQETSNDGCSAANTAPAVVSLGPTGPIGASTTTLTFASCGDWQEVTFTAAADAAPGDYPVSVSVSDADGDTYGGGGPVTIRVTAPSEPPPPSDTTKPVVTAPSDQVLEATSPAGASQTYQGTAVDDVDGALPAPCAPSTFPLGSTTVTCTATDSAGNIGQDDFTVVVQDTTPPVLSVPGPITAGATSPAGASVSFSASAADVVDGAVAPVCAPASGSTFAVGTTTVACTATDTRGNSTSGSFTVTVTNSGPTVLVPGTQTVEAFDASGALVNFVPQPTATDVQDGPLVPVCSPASGSRFALGQTTVTCTATDSSGASGVASFVVVVRDTTAPVVTPPKDFLVVTDAPLARDHPLVAPFLAAASAADQVGVVALVSNAPPVLPLGTTTVTFTAFDAAGNMGVASATIELRRPTPGQPTPPASPPPVRVPPANVGDFRILALDRAVRLEWRAAPTGTRYVLSRSDRGGETTIVYDGRATAFVDRGLVNGDEYRYVVVTFDADGLRSVGVAVVAVPRRPILLSPRHGAAVPRPPLLTWRKVARASYYNLQLFRVASNGTRTKIMSTWPTKNSVRLPARWRYGRQTMRLSRGTYEWYLWAGFGRRATQNYGPLLGWSRFTVRPPATR